jgi:Carboxypeptidase regulatory-like domain
MLWLWLLLSIVQSPMPRDGMPARSSAAGTAGIRGRITEDETGRPFPRAVVTISTSPGDAQEVPTDDEGRFAVDGLAAGAYVVGAGPGELLATHLPRFFGGPPWAGNEIRAPRIVLKDGEVRTNVDIALVRAVAIEGRVIDTSGEAMARVAVTAINLRTELSSPAFETDDRGSFRVFGLPPGVYRVCATPRRASDPEGREAEARTCAPSIASDSQAEVITVKHDVDGVQIVLQRRATYSVSGSVIDSAGIPVSGRVGILSNTVRESGSVVEAIDGQFVAKGLLPGAYLMMTTIRGPSNPGDTSPKPDKEVGLVPLQIDGDLQGVVLRTSRAARISGRLVFEGGRPATSQKMSVYVPYIDEMLHIYPGAPPRAEVGNDGRFVLEGLFGRNTLSVLNLPSGSVVKAIRYNGADITDLPTVFPAGTDGSSVEIVVTNQSAQVSARVVDAEGRRQTDCLVWLAPTDRTRWGERLMFLENWKDDAIWGFRRPGEYLVAAVGPDDAARLRALGTRGFDLIARVAEKITLAEGERRTIDLKLVDPDSLR